MTEYLKETQEKEKKKGEWNVAANCHLPHIFLGHDLTKRKKFKIF